DEAIKYYKEAAVYGYNGARTYELLAQTYIEKPDTTGALTILQEGFEKYPESHGVVFSQRLPLWLSGGAV
ncbi:MAG: hypothetical protein OIF34_14765, partial [Porticoccaceae bacterium]|nr:hypothetical protein [Porticoccaceae bacterium]